jgi:hypothetical protein
MATTNHPENQQPQGGATDLGQISIKPTRFDPMRIENPAGGATRIAVTYYGTMHTERPANDAQLSLSTAGFDACIQIQPGELRQLASYLCKAAVLIEEGEALFDMSKYNFGD